MSRRRWPMLRLLVLTISLPWLTGCAMGVSSPVCPSLVNYSPAFQNRLADEVAALPSDDPLVTVVADYGRLRDQVRACRGE